MSSQPTVLGTSQDPESSHEYFVSRNNVTPDKLRPAILDETLLGMDPKSQVNWKRPHEVFKGEPKPIQSTTALAQCLPRSVAVTDCKSLYDLVTRTAQPNCQEFRTQLQAKAIKDLLSEGIQLRWVHTGAQLADALTKVMQGTFLRYTLQRGMYQLNDELQVLKERADSRTRLRWLESGIPLMGDQQQEG